MPILQALLRSAAEYFAYLVSLGCRNQALSGAHFFKISLCSIFAKNIANLVSLEICKQISARSLSLACALIGHYLGSLLQARHVFFLSAFTARWSKKYIFYNFLSTLTTASRGELFQEKMTWPWYIWLFYLPLTSTNLCFLS